MATLSKQPLELQPGRWLVEVEEGGFYSASRVYEDDSVGLGENLHGLNHLFDRIADFAAERKAAAVQELEEEANE